MEFTSGMRLSFGHNPVIIRWPTEICVTILANVVVLIRIRHYAAAPRRVSVLCELDMVRPLTKVLQGNITKVDIAILFHWFDCRFYLTEFVSLT